MLNSLKVCITSHILPHSSIINLGNVRRASRITAAEIIYLRGNVRKTRRNRKRNAQINRELGQNQQVKQGEIGNEMPKLIGN